MPLTVDIPERRFPWQSTKDCWAVALLLAARWLAVALLVGAAKLPAEAAYPGVNGKLAFVSNRDGGYQIYAVNVDGSGLTKLTENLSYPANPAWSPDGTKIAFWRFEADVSRIRIANADGSGGVDLTEGRFPSWSPDGTKITFTGGVDPVSLTIYRMNADGTGQTALTDGAGRDHRPVWSPDGTKIAFVSGRDGNKEIYVMQADGSDQTNLTNSPGSDDDFPDWSPDATKIAFTTYRGGSFEIYVMNADGASQTNLTNNRWDDGLPAWSPDGTQIAFTTNRAGGGDIYVMNADGTGATRLTRNAAWDTDPEWQPFHPPAADNYICYWAKDVGVPPRTFDRVNLVDQFETADYDVTGVFRLCTPASRSGSGVMDPLTHLSRYTLNRVSLGSAPRATLDLATQFGTTHLRLLNATDLMVPTSEDLNATPPPPDPTRPGFEHYKCYRVAPATPGRPGVNVEVSLADQFGTRSLVVRDPVHLCTPAAADGTLVTNGVRQLLCHRIRRALRPPIVSTSDRFGPATLKLGMQRELCVPAADPLNSSTP